jgi:hypothetical protein
MNAELQAKLEALSEEQQSQILAAISDGSGGQEESQTAPPEPPKVNSPQAKAFERESQAYVSHLLSKPGLTKTEQEYIARELGAWRRETGLR